MKTDPGAADRPSIVVQAPRQTANWIIAVALSVIATAVVLRPDLGFVRSAVAQNASLGGRGGMMAFTGQLDRNAYGLFMIDQDTGTVWVYEYAAARKTLKLVAARSFLYDRYLEKFNPSDPLPEQVEVLLKRERAAKQRAALLGGTAATGADPVADPPTPTEVDADRPDGNPQNLRIQVSPAREDGGGAPPAGEQGNPRGGDAEELKEVEGGQPGAR